MHDLVRLERYAQATIPEFRGLKYPLALLPLFSGAEIYSTPHLRQDIEILFTQVQTDVTYIFSLIQAQSDFDPWTVQELDCQF